MLASRIVVRLGIIILLFLIGILIISVFTTSPDNLGPYGITVWFIALFVAASGIWAALLFWYKKLAKKGVEKSLLLGEALRQGVLISIWLSSVLALNSLKQLSLRDIVLITLLLVLIEFYMRRGRGKTAKY